MKILVVGGAGYIGSHAVRALMRAGHEVRVFDNLGYGHAEAVPAGPLIGGDLADRAALDAAPRAADAIDAVMHFAAFASVPESVDRPGEVLPQQRRRHASTCSTPCAPPASGGSSSRAPPPSTACPTSVPIPEDEPDSRPINPYGFTKLAIERALADYAAPTAWATPPSATSTPAAPPTTARSARTTRPRRT